MALFVASNAHAAALPDDCAQLIVALAPDWNSVHGRLYLLQKAGGKWRAQAGPVPVLFGKNGLAWGSGIAARASRACENTSAMAGRPPALFASERSLPMMPRCRRVPIIHFIR